MVNIDNSIVKITRTPRIHDMNYEIVFSVNNDLFSYHKDIGELCGGKKYQSGQYWSNHTIGDDLEDVMSLLATICIKHNISYATIRETDSHYYVDEKYDNRFLEIRKSDFLWKLKGIDYKTGEVNMLIDESGDGFLFQFNLDTKKNERLTIKNWDIIIAGA